LWSSCEHDRRAASITPSKRVDPIQQLSQSFDSEHLRETNTRDGLLAISVRPGARNLHRPAVEVPHNDAMCIRVEHLELLIEERMMGTGDLHPV
jgi:hypothetical protein